MQLLESEHDEIVAGPSDRNFGFTMAAVFTLIGGFGLYKGSSHAPLWLCVAAVLAGLTLWRPHSLNRANRAWLKLGLLMYRVVNPVILAILVFRRDPAGRTYHAHVRQGFPQTRTGRLIADLLATAFRSETAV